MCYKVYTMPDLGKTLELDEAKSLANHVLARAIEDATRHSAGEYDTHLTKRVGVEAYNFLTSMDDECVKDRAFWCSVAGYDADLLVEKVAHRSIVFSMPRSFVRSHSSPAAQP